MDAEGRPRHAWHLGHADAVGDDHQLLQGDPATLMVEPGDHE